MVLPFEFIASPQASAGGQATALANRSVPCVHRSDDAARQCRAPENVRRRSGSLTRMREPARVPAKIPLRFEAPVAFFPIVQRNILRPQDAACFASRYGPADSRRA